MRPLLPLTLLLDLIGGCAAEAVRVDSGLETEVSRADLGVIVVDGASGEPVVGAWVVVSPSGRDAQTDTTGTAWLRGLGAGEGTIEASAPGYRASRGVPVTVTEAGAQARVTLVAVDAAAGAIGGFVYEPGADMLPLADARIEVDGTIVTQSGADGAWAAEGLSPGAHTLAVRPPVGTSLGSWQGPTPLTVAAGKTTFTAVVLPGGAPADADFVGSDTCATCHPDAVHAGNGHMAARFSRAQIEADGPSGIAAAFAAGEVLSLGPTRPGATVTLGADWTMDIADGQGASTGPLAVTEVYGGHDQGVAFGVTLDGETRVAPVAWALQQAATDTDGFVPTWADGWFGVDGALVDDPDLDWTLQCAGCHVTGHKLVEAAGTFSLAPVGSGEIEQGVGCEACHGPGSAHVDDQLATSILDPARLPAAQRVDGCARCHEATTSVASVGGARPAWPVDGEGNFLSLDASFGDMTRSARVQWDTVPVSRVWRDEVGDFAGAPHRTGAYLGACEDCHAAHGSDFRAGLRVDPNDPTLCTTCHATRFPDAASVLAHSRHAESVETDWGPSTCVGCHFPRSGVLLATDPLSGVGAGHAHSMTPWSPASTVAAFELAGVDTLPLGDAPTSPCLDCHLQARAEADAVGTGLSAPTGDATARTTHENLQVIYDYLFGSEP